MSARPRPGLVSQWAGLAAGAASFGMLIGVLNPIQMLSVGLWPFSPQAFRAVNRWCARTIWGAWVVMGERHNGIEFRLTGDAPRKAENAILIPNHQSMADVMVLLMLGWRSARLGDMKWFVKDPVKYVPGPGWGMRFLDCIFVKRDWSRDEAGIEAKFGRFRREQIPIFLVSFLEGTRKTPRKLERARAFAEARGMPVPKNTLIPRTKGFVATMKGLRDHVDSVLDVTIAYPDGVPSLSDCFARRVARVDVHLRRFAVEDLPTDEAQLGAWALQVFREKDAMLAQHRQDGAFPGDCLTGPVRAGDWFRPELQRACPRPSEPAGSPAPAAE